MTKVVEGVLIAESIRAGCELSGLRLAATRLSRQTIAEPASYQPKVWTVIEFTADTPPEELAQRLGLVLDSPGWYVDFHTSDATYVVFPGKVFRYARGDLDRREEAIAYGRTAGIPDAQLDWAE